MAVKSVAERAYQVVQDVAAGRTKRAAEVLTQIGEELSSPDIRRAAVRLANGSDSSSATALQKNVGRFAAKASSPSSVKSVADSLERLFESGEKKVAFTLGAALVKYALQQFGIKGKYE